jgi:hypothetical protein
MFFIGNWKSVRHGVVYSEVDSFVEPTSMRCRIRVVLHHRRISQNVVCVVSLYQLVLVAVDASHSVVDASLVISLARTTVGIAGDASQRSKFIESVCPYYK